MRFLKIILLFLGLIIPYQACFSKNFKQLQSANYPNKYFAYEDKMALAIDKPFKINSEDHLNQIQQIIILQKNIDIKDVDLALAEKQLRPETLVQKICKSCSRKKFSNLYHLLDRVGDTSREVTDGIKNYWKIPRPYIFDKNVQMIISPSKGYSYPSGHTTGSYIYAGVIGLLSSNKIDKLQEYANQIAWHRVQVGMHYPQDLIGGKQLAIFLIGGLMQNQEFKNDFINARNEIRQAGLIK